MSEKAEEKTKKESMQKEVKHQPEGVKVDTAERVWGLSTGKSKHLPKKDRKFWAHPAQMAYFIDRGYATELKK